MGRYVRPSSCFWVLRFEIGGSKASEGVCCYFYYRYRSFIVVVIRFNLNFFSYTLSLSVPCPVFLFILYSLRPIRYFRPCHAIPYTHIVLHRTALNCTTLHYPYHAAAARFHIVPPPPPLHHSSFIIHPSIHHLVSVITYQSSILVITRFCSSPRLSEHPNTEHRPTPPHLPSLSLSLPPPNSPLTWFISATFVSFPEC